LASPIKLQKIDYGKSFHGVPLTAYKIFNDETLKTASKKAILLTEGVHGNEYNGLLNSFIDLSIKSPKVLTTFSKFLKNNGVIYLIPKLNPDAVLKKSRRSILGADLNRDFMHDRLQAQETFTFATWLDSELQSTNAKLYLSVDYHCCGGALLSPKLSSQKSFYKTQYNKISALIKKHVSTKLVHSKSHDFWGKSVTGTLKDFLHNKYGSLSFTYEAKIMGSTENTVSNHSKWWASVANHLNNSSFKRQIQASKDQSIVSSNHLLSVEKQANLAE
jgi:predicted deacylase